MAESAAEKSVNGGALDPTSHQTVQSKQHRAKTEYTSTENKLIAFLYFRDRALSLSLLDTLGVGNGTYCCTNKRIMDGSETIQFV
jgi:hypothetical protein